MTEREEKIKKFFFKWEGGYSNHPLDTGGCTMRGITLATYRRYYGKNKTCQDLKKITDEEWMHIFKKGYYDKAKCDKINNDSIALLVCDMCWGSGPVTTIKKIQYELGCKVDGIIGRETLAALNDNDSEVFNRLWKMRYEWFHKIVANRPSNKVFLKGWLNRLNDIKFQPNL